VAIVEDNSQIREGLRFLIDSTSGYCVTGTFGSMEEAAPAIAGGGPRVVLMDIGLLRGHVETEPGQNRPQHNAEDRV
jgi:DNA-binding NarL/FixJ family response regulator